MIDRLRTSLSLPLLAGSLVLGGVAHGQSGLKLGSEAEEPPKVDLGAPRQAPTPAAAPSAGQAARAPAGTASQPDGQGPEVSRVTHGAWEVACAANGQCAMAQIGEDKDGVPILEMVIRKLEEPLEVDQRTAIAVLDVVTPLGVVLTDGLALTIDAGKPEAAPFRICTEQGCLVREPIDQALVDRLKRGSNAKITVTAANQGPVETTLSLSGFTKAYGEVK